MTLVTRPVNAHILFQILLKEPLFQLATDTRESVGFHKHFMKHFLLSLNDIKLNRETPANNFYHFSKGDGSAFLDVSYGLQEIRATLWNAQNAEQALHVYQGLLWNLQAENVATLRIEVQYHLAVEGDHRHFLRSLNPTVPREFEPLLKTNGVAYTIGIDEESLTIQVTVVPSVIVPSGLYLSVAYDFLKFGADWLAKIPELTQKYQKFVQLALGLDVKEAL